MVEKRKKEINLWSNKSNTRHSCNKQKENVSSAKTLVSHISIPLGNISTCSLDTFAYIGNYYLFDII